MNEAHRESLALLNIVNTLCEQKQIAYSIAGPTLIAYEHGMAFDQCVPSIYLALPYPDYVTMRESLLAYCAVNPGYSFHDYINTEQMDSFDGWFVKEASMAFPEAKKKDTFYYGTRLVLTPLFYAGEEEVQWEEAYRLFRDTTYTLSIGAVLTGKPLRSFLKLSPKRRLSNHYIAKRGLYTHEKCLQTYGAVAPAKYVVYPFVVERDKRDSNSLPQMVGEASKSLTLDLWSDIEEIVLWGQRCYAVKNRAEVLKCFPAYYIHSVLDAEKSHLALNGNAYLWRVQQIQLELLKEFDRICRKHGISYNISFGTLLGAIRHGGFIPWDDDIDVTLRAADFDRLDEIMRAELDPERYYFRCPENEPQNHLIFKHLERKETVYTKPGRNKLEHTIGVFIDVFPMYPSAHLRLSDWIHAKVCRYWRTALWATVGAESEKDSQLRAKYRKMAAPGNAVCYRKFVRAASFFRNNKYLKFWIAMDRNPYKVPLVRASNYTDTIDVEFEGYPVMAPRHYEEVLNYCFGVDWKKYPSMSERVSTHQAVMEIGDLYQKESEGKR